MMIASPGVLVVKAGDCHVTQVHVLQVKVDKVLLLPGVHSILVEPEYIKFDSCCLESLDLYDLLR